VMVLSSHAGDSATELCWRRRCRGDLVMMRCRCRVMLAMVLPSHTSDDAARVTWPLRDVDVESCWR
jgi:hypothetical protein